MTSCRQVADEAEIRAGVESRSGRQFRVITDACERHVCCGHDDQSAVENRQIHGNEAADWFAGRPIARLSGNLKHSQVYIMLTVVVICYGIK